MEWGRIVATMFLNAAEVAKRLNVCQQCVYQLVESGKLVSHRIGVGRGTIRISEDDLAEYLESCRVEKEAVQRRKNRKGTIDWF